MTSPLRLSYTRARSFDECPAKFKAEYIDSRPGGVAEPHMLVGTVVHECCDRYVTRLKVTGQSSDFDAMEDIFAEVWRSPLRSGLPESYRDEVYELCLTAREMLIFESPDDIAGSELKLAVDRSWRAVEYDSPDAFLRARIDRLDVSPEGAVVTDYKTGRRMEQLESSRQTPLYAAMVESKFEPAGFPITVSLVYLRHRVIKAAPATRLMIDRAKAWIEGVAVGIENAIKRNLWPARPGLACRGCAAFKTCPARLRTVKPVPPENEAAAVEMVERLVLLERERREIIDVLGPWVDQFGDIDVNGVTLGYDVSRQLRFDPVRAAEILKARGFQPLDFMHVDGRKIKELGRRDSKVRQELTAIATDASKTTLKLSITGENEEWN